MLMKYQKISSKAGYPVYAEPLDKCIWIVPVTKKITEFIKIASLVVFFIFVIMYTGVM